MIYFIQGYRPFGINGYTSLKIHKSFDKMSTNPPQKVLSENPNVYQTKQETAVLPTYCADCNTHFSSLHEHDEACTHSYSAVELHPDETDVFLECINQPQHVSCVPDEYSGRKAKGRSRGHNPQFGLEAIASSTFAIDALARFANIDIPDRVLREIEGVILLLTTLSQQTTSLGAVSTVLTWAQGRTTSSIFKTVKGFIEELLVAPQSSSTPDWLDCLRDLRQNWQLCRSNRAFAQISKLLGCLVMLGLCNVSQVTFSVGDFKLFAPSLCDAHTTAFDVADAIFETVVFFTEGAYLCFQTGSIKPLLVNDRTSMELDTEFTQIVAWYELVRNGNLKKFTDVTDQEFERRMNRLSTSLTNLVPSLKGLDKKLVTDKLSTVLTMQNDYATMKIASGIRHAPWAFELFGESSQGKTTMGDQLIDALLTSQGMPTDRIYRCVFNASDKFMSGWTSDKLVMIFDDMSNDKAAFVEKAPTRVVLDVINNQMAYANKAEMAAKGKCFIEPHIVCATTNKKDLDAGTYSNCPYSIQRRFACLTVKAKPQFQRIEDGILCGIDSRKVREYYTDDEGLYTPPMFDDIWCVTVEKAIKPENLRNVAKYAPVNFEGRPLVDVNMATVIRWAIEDFAEHQLNQNALLEGMAARECVMKRCNVDGCHHLVGNCWEHDLQRMEAEDAAAEEAERLEAKSDEDAIADAIDDREHMEQCRDDCLEEEERLLAEAEEDQFHDAIEPQFGKETVGSLRKLWYGAKDPLASLEGLYDRADKEASQVIYDKGIEFLSGRDWIKAIPSVWFNHKYAPAVFNWLYKDEIIENYAWESRRLWLTLIVSLAAAILAIPNLYFKFLVCFYSFTMFVSTKHELLDRVTEELFQKLKKKNMQLSPILRRYRDSYAKYICGVSIGIAAVYGLARAYKAYRENVHATQGSLEPKTPKDVAQRDSEVNVWTGVTLRDLPITDYSKRMSPDQLADAVKKALVYGSIHTEDGNGMVNGLMLSSNAILIPDHYFSEFGDQLDITFRKKNPESSGGKFTARLHVSLSHLIPNSELRVCYCPNGGSFKNLVNFFPTGAMPPVPFQMHWRKKTGEMILAKGMSNPGVVQTWKTFLGGSYKNLTIDTFDGLCGATLVSDTNGSVVLGVHVGGTEGTPTGVYCSVTQQELFVAFADLRTKEGVILSGEAGQFRTNVLGVQVLKTDPTHAKSPLNFLPQDSQIENLGTCIGRAVNTTDVKVTPMSEHVADVCDEPNIYHGPKLNPEWYGWQTCLANMAIPAHPFPPTLLNLAIRDYKEPLLDIFKSAMWKETKPLNDTDNLCGVHGVKFLDPIKLSTAVGFPLSGPKRDFVIDVEATEDEPAKRVLCDELVEEIEYNLNCYRSGKRAYPIAKACKKDEILSKEKCRIFYGNPLSLTFLVRKYFLPIIRVMEMNPLKSECAVGINSHGPEWQEFHDHVMKYGEDRLFGGDYGKYDQKLPSQLLFASLRILIDFARCCDYSEEDIRVMEAMTGDLVFAYIAFNGDLIGLTEGSHISGNSLTVILNGISGSLNLRAFFYSVYKPSSFAERKNFRDNVAAMTYGDDNIGSVAKDCDKFTIKGCSEFLAKYGQVYTMPDKESELLDFLPREQFEFLKRQTVYHPKLGVHVGALLDKSIYKSLHCFLRGKNSPITEEFACALNIDTALTEWFNHGEDKYERQRGLMQEVASRTGISHMCTGLERTYDDRVVDWVAKYVPAET